MALEHLAKFSALDDDKGKLDRLDDIRLMGFQTNDETPTSATTSLPTPRAAHPSLAPIEVAPNTSFTQQFRLLGDDQYIQVPAAPLMKDYDTFTEGTAKGSFDSIPAASTDQFGELLPRLDKESLDTLPPDDMSRTIEMWRDTVSMSIPDNSPISDPQCEMPSSEGLVWATTPTKRPRSITSDDGVRRIRARARSLSVTSSEAPIDTYVFADGATIHNCPIRAQPRLRACSAPPDARVPFWCGISYPRTTFIDSL